VLALPSDAVDWFWNELSEVGGRDCARDCSAAVAALEAEAACEAAVPVREAEAAACEAAVAARDSVAALDDAAASDSAACESGLRLALRLLPMLIMFITRGSAPDCEVSADLISCSISLSLKKKCQII
jgi:hypothetical protein